METIHKAGLVHTDFHRNNLLFDRENPNKLYAIGR